VKTLFQRMPITRALLAAALTLSATSTAFAALNQFTGNWRNVNANTGGVTKLTIAAVGNNVEVHAWGKCHPTDCDWGNVQGYAYAGSVQDNLAAGARAVSAVYRTNFSETVMVIHPGAPNHLQVETMTRFTDNSGRTSYSAVEMFARARDEEPLKEDCVSFNPQTTTVANVGGRWKIVDGSHWMFDFGNNQAEANRSLAVIRHYRMNQSCFVGRPDPSFQYLLISGQAPQGSMPGEDCVSFNPQTATVANIGGRWKIVDGSHWMFDFGNNQAEAKQSLQIIKHYGFAHSCFVGRPDPSFQYLRR